MRVSVDLNVCQGHGVCHMSEPRVYELDETDVSAIIDGDAVRGLKFASLLPDGLARLVLTRRLADVPSAQQAMLPARANGIPASRSTSAVFLRTAIIRGSGARSGIDERVPWGAGRQTPSSSRRHRVGKAAAG